MTTAGESFSKLARPCLRETLPRQRLFSQLDAAQQSSILWVVGPPGAGKTTLAASYLEHRRLSSLWYQVDEGDADVASFFYHLGLAGNTDASDHEPLPLFTPEYAQGLAVFTRRFFGQLAARLSPPFVLVLDNYQLVPDESPLHEIIVTAGEALAGSGQILVVSRAPPPAAFARLQANRSLEILDWEALKLRDEEVAALARLLKGEQALSETALEQLARQCAGWAAGLILLLRGMWGNDLAEIAPLGAGDPPQVLFDYFANEIIQQLDASGQDFLLRTAILPSMTPAMARELSGNPEADRLLVHLNRHHYFTERHGQSDPRYQYHPLFREFLLASARQRYDDAAFRDLQCQAASLLERHDEVDAAVELRLSAEDWSGSTRLIVERARQRIMQGRGETVKRWILHIPQSMLADAPWLRFWLGIACVDTEPLAGRGQLEHAYRQFKEAGDIPGMALALVGIVDTFSFGWFDFIPLDGWIDELEALLGTQSELLSTEIRARLAVAMFVALMHRRPDHPDMAYWTQQARMVARNAPSTTERVIIGVHLATYYTWWGNNHEMALLTEELEPLLQRSDVSPIALIAFQGILCLYYNRLSAGKGKEQARAALERAEQSGVYILTPFLLNVAAQACLNEGDLDTATDYLSRCSALFQSARLMDQAFYLFNHGHMAWLRGDVAGASDHIRQCLEIVKRSGSAFLGQAVPMNLAKILVEAGEYREAERIIERTLRVSRAFDHPALQYECRLVAARCAFAQHDDAGGLEALRKALTIMRQIDAEHTSLWKPQWIIPLFSRALEAGIEVAFVQSLIQKHNLLPDSAHDGVEQWPWPVKIRALGGFELECRGEALVFKGKAQKKPLELLQALVAFGGKNVSAAKLADALWPESEGDVALQSLKTALHRLRRLLDCADAVEVHDGKASLNPRYCWIDVWAFERLLQTPAGTNGQAATNRTKASALYRGVFLEGEDNASWVLGCRERLHDQFVKNTVELGRQRERQGQWEEALHVYEQGLRIDDHIEPFYQGSMRCYDALGRQAEAMVVFARCRGAIEASKGMPISESTVQLAKRLRNPR